MRFCPRPTSLSERTFTAVYCVLQARRVFDIVELRETILSALFEGQAGSLVQDSSFDLSILRTCRAVHDFVRPRLYESVLLRSTTPSFSTFARCLGLIQERRRRVAINDLSFFVEDERRRQVGLWRH